MAKKTNILRTIYVLILRVLNTHGNSSHFSTLRMRMEMVLKMLVFSPFNHLTWLVAREDFIRLLLPEN
jgi:hypothetical protein